MKGWARPALTAFHQAACKSFRSRTVGVPTPGTSLASAAMGSVAHTRRGGAGRLPQLHAGPRCVTWPPTSGDGHLRVCAGGLVTTAPERHQGQVTAFPMEAVPRVLPTVHPVSLHPTADSSRDGVPQPRLPSQQELSRSVSLSLKLRSGTEASTPNNSGAGPAPDVQG